MRKLRLEYWTAFKIADNSTYDRANESNFEFTRR
jgi:hypothetical protein